MPIVYSVARTDDALTISNHTAGAPTLIGALPGVGAPNYLNGAYDIFVYGDYAYIAASAEPGLTIVNISNPVAPVTVGHMGLPAAPVAIWGGNGSYFDYIYMLYGNTFIVVDVSDPTAPVIHGTIPRVTVPAWVPHGLRVVGDLAYVCGNGHDDLTILNLADRANPVFLGEAVGAGAPNWLNGAEDVRVRGNYAYVAAQNDDSLTIVDVTNPAAPATVGHIAGVGAPNWLDNAMALELYGQYAVVVAQQDDAVTVINITNPAAPVLTGSIQNGGVVSIGAPVDIKIENNFAYVVCEMLVWGQRLSVIDLSNPAVPVYVGSLEGAGPPNYMDTPHGVALLSLYQPTVQTLPATEVT